MLNKKRLAMMAVAASMMLPTNLAYLSVVTPVFADEVTIPENAVELDTTYENNYIPTGTYKLTQNLSLSGMFWIDDNVTIYLNGFSISSTNKNTIGIVTNTKEDGTEKFGNLTIIGNGTIASTATEGDTSVIFLNEPSTTLSTSNGVNITHAASDGWGIIVDKGGFNATVDLKDTTITAFGGLTVNGEIVEEEKKPTFTLDKVTITASNIGIYQAGVSDITVKGGTISGATGIEVRAGNLTVQDKAIINGNKDAATEVLKARKCGNGTTTEHAAIAVAQHVTKQPITVNIQGQSTLSAYAPLAIIDPQGNKDSANITVNVKEATLTPNAANTDYAIGYTDDFNTILNVTDKTTKIRKIKIQDGTYTEDTLKPFDLIPDITDYDLSGDLIINADSTADLTQVTLKENSEATEIEFDPEVDEVTYTPDLEEVLPGDEVEISVTMDDSDSYTGTATGTFTAQGDLSQATVIPKEGDPEGSITIEVEEGATEDDIKTALSNAIVAKYGDQEIASTQYEIELIPSTDENSSSEKFKLVPSDSSSYINETEEISFGQLATEVTVTVDSEGEYDLFDELSKKGASVTLPLDTVSEDLNGNTYTPNYDEISKKLDKVVKDTLSEVGGLGTYDYKVVPKNPKTDENQDASDEEITLQQAEIKISLNKNSLIRLIIKNEAEGEIALFTSLEGAEKDDNGNTVITDTVGNLDKNNDNKVTSDDLEKYDPTISVPKNYTLDTTLLQRFSDVDKDGYFTDTVEDNSNAQIDLVNAVITLDKKSYDLPADGSQVVPKVSVKVGNTELQPGIDYKYSLVNGDKVGTAKVIIEPLSDKYTGTGYTTFTITEPSTNQGSSNSGGGGGSSRPRPKPEEPTPTTPVATPTSMYRLYNKLTGEHLYTIDKKERDNLLTSDTWKDEGQGWIAPSESNYPVYRLLNPNNGDHHYTMDKNEFDTLPTYGWVAEGLAFFSADKDNPENVILHRLYNPNTDGAGSHHYTADTNERDTLVTKGWEYEGTAWAGLPAEK